MYIHHIKHHAGYIKGALKAQEELAKMGSEDYKMAQYWGRKLSFCSGGHFLHSLFWRVMAPAKMGGGAMTPFMAKMLSDNFKSVENFKGLFSAMAAQVEGSGWGILAYQSATGQLHVFQVENQQKLCPAGMIPVLGLDAWEHAYYLSYQNQRKKYIKNWWNVVAWSEVEKNIRALS